MNLSDQTKGILLIISASVLLGAMILVFLLQQSKKEKDEKIRDKKTLCRSDIKYPHTIILFDVTDGLTERQHQKIKDDYINKIIGELETEEKLTAYVLNATNYLAPTYPEFEKCKPPSDGNPIYQNPYFIKEKFENEFLRPFLTSIPTFTNTVEAQSPILETITAISRIENFNDGRKSRSPVQ